MLLTFKGSLSLHVLNVVDVGYSLCTGWGAVGFVYHVQKAGDGMVSVQVDPYSEKKVMSLADACVYIFEDVLSKPEKVEQMKHCFASNFKYFLKKPS